MITNNTLAGRAGSELYVRDLAIALMRRGHSPVAYSQVLGEVAEELRQATIPVIDDLAQLSFTPDIIHGQHHLETMTAVLHFPGTPALFTCHGWAPWEELPPVFPSILRYVAVDELCLERLLTTAAIAEEKTLVLSNFVDLERFPLRGPLPQNPKSALIFSNYAGDGLRVEAIRAACARAGIERVDLVGAASGNGASKPEAILGAYDVVFAKARCGLEAMASGCSLVVADFAGLGGLVTTDNMVRMRCLNFGVRTMQAGPLTEEAVLRELQRYNADDARKVSEWVRGEADMSAAVSRWLDVYAEVLEEWRSLQDSGAADLSLGQLRAASNYVRSLGPVLRKRHEVDIRANDLRTALVSSAWKAMLRYRKFRSWLNRQAKAFQ
ncbi:MAG: glycosyltransferase [Proteobacteria bacterium]|nr:glycosyltransferase [Pseudomonadota bacterium]MBU1594536.1 glycosyltransferase [Pseudomonadota bacterium]